MDKTESLPVSWSEGRPGVIPGSKSLRDFEIYDYETSANGQKVKRLFL